MFSLPVIIVSSPCALHLKFRIVTMLVKTLGFYISAISASLSCVNGFPSWTLVDKRAELDTWIANENTIAFAGVLANFGPSGAKAYGAASGILLASPSKIDPDCNTSSPFSISYSNYPKISTHGRGTRRWCSRRWWISSPPNKIPIYKF